jgi:hypothetical protein
LIRLFDPLEAGSICQTCLGNIALIAELSIKLSTNCVDLGIRGSRNVSSFEAKFGHPNQQLFSALLSPTAAAPDNALLHSFIARAFASNKARVSGVKVIASLL